MRRIDEQAQAVYTKVRKRYAEEHGEAYQDPTIRGCEVFQHGPFTIVRLDASRRSAWGLAECSERDEMNLAIGEGLALARAARKLAAKRPTSPLKLIQFVEQRFSPRMPKAGDKVRRINREGYGRPVGYIDTITVVEGVLFACAGDIDPGTVGWRIGGADSFWEFA